GALLTQQLRLPMGRGHLRLSFTFGYTTPFDYLLHGQRAPNDPAGLSSNIDYLMARPLKSNVPGDTTALDWLGFEQGPDAIVAKGAIAHDPLPGLYLALFGSHTWRGQNDERTMNLRTAAQAELVTPSGKVTRTLQLGGSAAYHPSDWLSLGAALYGSRVIDHEGHDGIRFEGTLTCRMTFGSSARERLFAFDGSEGT
ncbi:MAG: hypothetical protein ACO3JL_17110, partial [Myxococcota bacterium]